MQSPAISPGQSRPASSQDNTETVPPKPKGLKRRSRRASVKTMRIVRKSVQRPDDATGDLEGPRGKQGAKSVSRDGAAEAIQGATKVSTVTSQDMTKTRSFRRASLLATRKDIASSRSGISASTTSKREHPPAHLRALTKNKSPVGLSTSAPATAAAMAVMKTSDTAGPAVSADGSTAAGASRSRQPLSSLSAPLAASSSFSSSSPQPASANFVKVFFLDGSNLNVPVDPATTTVAEVLDVIAKKRIVYVKGGISSPTAKQSDRTRSLSRSSSLGGSRPGTPQSSGRKINALRSDGTADNESLATTWVRTTCAVLGLFGWEAHPDELITGGFADFNHEDAEALFSAFSANDIAGGIMRRRGSSLFLEDSLLSKMPSMLPLHPLEKNQQRATIPFLGVPLVDSEVVCDAMRDGYVIVFYCDYTHHI